MSIPEGKDYNFSNSSKHDNKQSNRDNQVSLYYQETADEDGHGGDSWENLTDSGDTHSTLGEGTKFGSLGCYIDKNEPDHAMPYRAHGQYSIRDCVMECGSLGYAYAGLQDYHHCFCGNEYKRHGSARSQNECYAECTVGGGTCGGPLLNSIYDTRVDSNFLGCFQDHEDGSNHVMPYHADGQYSIHDCLSMCASLGYMYAGLQNHSDCLCGNEYRKQEALLGSADSESECNMDCKYGEGVCGGAWRNSVFYSMNSKKYEPVDSGSRILLERNNVFKEHKILKNIEQESSAKLAVQRNHNSSITTRDAPASACVDSPYKFKINSKGRKKKTVTCAWVASEKTDKRCKKKGVDTMCPFTCNACGADSGCVDALLKFQFRMKGKKVTKNCEWIRMENPKRCIVPGIRNTCRNTCICTAAQGSPGSIPTVVPTDSGLPSSIPTFSPTDSSLPSSIPTFKPTESSSPISIPTFSPTDRSSPSSIPSIAPSDSGSPSLIPIWMPTNSDSPSLIPISIPTNSDSPSLIPISIPTNSDSPSLIPISIPTNSDSPSLIPLRCEDDSECSKSEYCSLNSCKTKLQNGQPCSSDSACGSDHCWTENCEGCTGSYCFWPNYIGCYDDNPSRILEFQLPGDKYDVFTCGLACHMRGGTVFGLEHWGQCFCSAFSASTWSNKGEVVSLLPSDYSPIPESYCRIPCSSNGDHICGGEWAISLYITTFSLTYHIADSCESNLSASSSSPTRSLSNYSATPSTAPTETLHLSAVPSATPTDMPTAAPTSPSPTRAPSDSPVSATPTDNPTAALTSPSPTRSPSDSPVSAAPTDKPTAAPTSPSPTRAPSDSPVSATPTDKPTAAPTSPSPTRAPSDSPVTPAPTPEPTPGPTPEPTPEPGPTPGPTPEPTPSIMPSGLPTYPSSIPSNLPTGSSAVPTSSGASRAPSALPSTFPTALSGSPTESGLSKSPSIMPSGLPTGTSGAPTENGESVSTSIIPSGLPTGVSSLPTASSTAPTSTRAFSSRDELDEALKDEGYLDPKSRASMTYGYPIGTWDVSDITDYSYLFYMNEFFNEDIGDWDVSNARNMSYMFAGRWTPDLHINTNTTNFNRDISRWDVSKVVDMSYMFYRNTAFNQNLGNWNVSSVIAMQLMFAFAHSFNRYIGDWNVGNVDNMSGMFYYADSFDQNIVDWNVVSVEDTSDMFHNAGAFRQNLCPWGEHMQSLRDANFMFWGSGCWEADNPNLSVKPVSPLCFDPCT